MKYSILTVGDEICIGQIVNTNASYIANALTNIGYSVYCHSTVPDEPEIMKSELSRLMDNSDVVIISGGLGPTHDDITKGVLTDFFDDVLLEDNSTMKYLEEWFESRGRIMTEVNRAQALVPSKSTALRNKVGTAPGILFKPNKKLVLALPGVPAEMKYIITNEFLPIAIDFFEEYSKEIQLYLTIKTVGIFESTLSDLIGNPIQFPTGASLAYLPSAAGVRLRIGAFSDNLMNAQIILDNMKALIENKAGKYIIGYGDEDLQSVIARLLKKNNQSVSVAESCTGGLLGASFTEKSGSSAFFKGGIIAYANEIKSAKLNVSNGLIAEYGAVSEQVAIEMAKNVRDLFNTDYGISITGIAGPDGGSFDKPVGTIWIALSSIYETKAHLFRFGNDRTMNRERSVTKALELLMQELSGK